MFEKKEKKFEKVPQIEIDGETYHETAEVAFGITKETRTENVGGNVNVIKTYTLKKYVMVRGKVFSETPVRVGEGSMGKAEVRNQLDIELTRELKRMEE